MFNLHTRGRRALRRHAYVSLEVPDVREFAVADPRGFPAQYTGPGRYVLPGSPHLLLLGRSRQTLAGRASVLHLLPFSRSERLGRRDLDLDALGARVPPRRGDREESLEATLLAGSYPPVHQRRLDPRHWYQNYFRTYVQRDVRDVLDVADLELFGRFLRLCAGRNGQLLNLSSLACDCGISHSTARRWLDVLETSFLVLRLRPYHRQAPGLFFWRDHRGNEVDVVLDRARGPLALEAKSGQTVTGDHLRGLRYWRRLAGDDAAPACLVHGGDLSMLRETVLILSWRIL